MVASGFEFLISYPIALDQRCESFSTFETSAASDLTSEDKNILLFLSLNLFSYSKISAQSRDSSFQVSQKKSDKITTVISFLVSK